MARTTLLRRQHDAALRLARHLQSMVAAYRGPQDAYPIATELARLLGLLRIHLAQEDASLYPSMIASGDADAAALATDYANEMGGLAKSVEQFMMRWASSTLIAGQIKEFGADLRHLLDALVDRIDRENRFLYPLADRMAEQEAARLVPPRAA